MLVQPHDLAIVHLNDALTVGIQTRCAASGEKLTPKRYPACNLSSFFSATSHT
jgi:hypothetical protein